LLYFGDPPFSIESLSDKLLASTYPFTSVAAYVSSNRTDQSLMTRQQLLKLQRALDNPPGQFSQSVLQYMGTFSRERNRPAPDWPHLNETGETSVLSEGRFNLNNLALVIPNPLDCQLSHGKKVGWQTGKNRNHVCGTPDSIIELFGLAWVISTDSQIPGYWKYIDHTGPNPPGGPDPDPHSIICFREGGLQKDFFQVLHYALNVGHNQTDRCGGIGQQARTFGIGASLIDQYDSGADCVTNQPINWGPGCDLDSHVNSQYRTHTTAIKYGQGGTNMAFAYGMELDNSVDPVNGDRRCGEGTNDPHRPSPAPPPITSPSPNQTIVVNHAFSNVGELGYGIDTSALATPGPSPTPACAPTQGPIAVPTLDFSSPDFPDAPMLDFFSYNPISSAYPRAGIVNLYTKNAPVLAAIIARTLQTDAAGNVTPNPTPVVSASDAMTAANAIVAETRAVLLGSATWPVRQTDMTRAIAARLAEKGGTAISGSWTKEQRQSIARALAEVGQTRTWNLFIDVIAQTGKYKPNAPDLTGSNFVIEGEKRYWLHIALGRDLVHTDGTPCLPGESGCQVDVLGTQLEEVVE
jgi:hypothetical protein